MFGKKSKRVTRIDSLIGKETEVRGDIHFNGGLHIDGKVKGNIVAVASQEPSSVLTLSEQGAIEGEIRVPNVILNGRVEGDVHVSEHIELALNARVNGNVYYNLIEMAMGAAVNGSLVHVDPAHPQQNVKPKDTKRSSLPSPESSEDTAKKTTS